MRSIVKVSISSIKVFVIVNDLHTSSPAKVESCWKEYFFNLPDSHYVMGNGTADLLVIIAGSFVWTFKPLMFVLSDFVLF